MLTARGKRGRQLLWKTIVEQNLIRQPLMVQPWQPYRLRHRQTAIDHVEDDLQHGGDDAAAARRASRQERLSILEHNGGSHGRERPLPWPRRVGFASGKPVGIGRAGLGGKIVELIVEQKPGSVGDEAHAIAEIERGRVGDGIAVPVNHGEMGCVVALARGQAAGADVGGGPRMLGINALAQLRGIGLGQQPLERRVDARGIAEEGGAVRIGEFHGLDREMQSQRFIRCEIVIAFEDVEHLDQDHAAGGGRGHGDDVIAAIAAAQRRALDGRIGSEILRRHHATGAAHGSGDLFSDRTLIEGARPLARNGGKGVCKIALHQRVAGGKKLAVGTAENLRGRRPARKPRACLRQ